MKSVLGKSTISGRPLPSGGQCRAEECDCFIMEELSNMKRTRRSSISREGFYGCRDLQRMQEKERDQGQKKEKVRAMPKEILEREKRKEGKKKTGLDVDERGRKILMEVQTEPPHFDWFWKNKFLIALWVFTFISWFLANFGRVFGWYE